MVDVAPPLAFATSMMFLVTFVVVVFVALPRIIRFALATRLLAVRDEMMDAMLDGRMPRSDVADDWVRTMDLVVDHTRWVAMSRALAVHRALSRHECELTDYVSPRPSRGSLTSEQRKLLHDLDARAREVEKRMLKWGSPLGWALTALATVSSWLERLSSHSTPRARARETSFDIEALSRDVRRANAAAAHDTLQHA